ncbi:hypothetical protein DL89DRAFT_267669 [Linderina pennispora]|uniref:G-protein coupled receptors family 1 profile domain-containing protein n=1 Tax=Linderina pennispora TaxID=61395 RepID=A0A1Y1W7Y5_9FUNG|nr:uncharacterized protein DL89DRAFT_267669 [Linderina pennispora]ORX69448.1 hypothetical protein DL89DRAFT_267669 [Linderina pennispora]
MSFELTPFEQSRVEIAAFLDVKLDPISHVDLSTIIVVSIVYMLDLFAFIYLFLNRNYPPIKAKSVYIMISLYAAAVLWFVGDIVTSGLVHLYTSNVLMACKMYFIWFRASFGTTYIATIFSVRTYALHRVFCQDKPFKGKLVWVCPALAVGWVLLLAVVSSLLPERMTTYYEDTLDLCYANTRYAAFVIGMICCFYSYIVLITWRLRKIPFSFNEFREVVTALVIIGVIIIVNSLAIFSVRIYPASAAWRNSLVYIDHTCANIAFWTIMWEPFYQCIMHREEYLQYWVDTLMEDGMEDAYNLTNRFPNETKRLVDGTEQDTAVESRKDLHDYGNAPSGNVADGTYCLPATLSELCLAKKLSHD